MVKLATNVLFAFRTRVYAGLVETIAPFSVQFVKVYPVLATAEDLMIMLR
jgi:hypothetical protein